LRIIVIALIYAAIALQQAGINIGEHLIKGGITYHAALAGLRHLLTLKQQQAAPDFGHLLIQQTAFIEFDPIQLHLCRRGALPVFRLHRIEHLRLDGPANV